MIANHSGYKWSKLAVLMACLVSVVDCHRAVNKLYCVEAILIENTTLFLAPPSVDIAIGEDQHQELSFKYKALSCWTQNRHVYNVGPTLGIVQYEPHTKHVQ